MEGLIKRAKGFLIFIGFAAFAFSILAEPNVDVQAQFTERGIDIEIFSALFLLGGFACFYTSFRGDRWLGMAFAPYFVFAGFAVEAALDNPAISGSTATAYLVLGGLLLIEYAIDHDYFEKFKEWLANGRTD